MKGQKICPSCKKPCGCRTLVCKCGYEFIHKSQQKKYKSSGPGQIKKTVNKNLVENWRELEPGEYIKVIKGSGPYCLIENDECEERVGMGYCGVFKIKGIGEDGIHAYPEGRGESGHCFIYMGEECTSTSGLIKLPHKIIRVKRKGRNV